MIHETAVVDPGAQVGEGTRIWHYSHVMPAARIGKNCILGQNTFVGNKVVIGDQVKIQNNVSIYEGVIIENDVFIGPSVVFTNVIHPRSFIEQKDAFLTTTICQGATIGANATILCGITIGKFAFIGAGSVVTKDVPAYGLVVGNPARITGYVDQTGKKIRKVDE